MTTSKVLVIGQGYVGLPLACELAIAAFDVVGLDLNASRVELIQSGHSGIDAAMDERLNSALAQNYSATTKLDDDACFDVVVVCVPTPLDLGGKVDLSAVVAAAHSGSSVLNHGGLFILESTSFPGTTEEHVLPELEKALGKIDEDFFLAFSPERIDPGNEKFTISNTPRIVGGVSAASGERAHDFYSSIVDDVVVVSGAREAEMAKLLENTYRQVNIALSNELAKVSHEMGIDYWEVLRGAATKPYGFQAFAPGPGVGGHCIPIDPMYLNEKVQGVLGRPLEFVELAQRVNDGMPHYVVERIAGALGQQDTSLDSSVILLLGASYKANVSDRRGAPLDDIFSSLHDRGARVKFHDPYCPEITVDGRTVTSVQELENEVESADVVVLLQSHTEYLTDGVFDGARLVFDSRGVLRGQNVVRL
jgi:UDP-N-acetyl-D-glucosamine dehydrogenase